MTCYFRKVKGEKKVLAEMQKLKDCGIPEENSFAFMFACCGRGRFHPTTRSLFNVSSPQGKGHHKGRHGLESSCFRKLFPRYLIIPCIKVWI